MKKKRKKKKDMSKKLVKKAGKWARGHKNMWDKLMDMNDQIIGR